MQTAIQPRTKAGNILRTLPSHSKETPIKDKRDDTMNLIEILMLTAFCFINMIVVHEWGHWIYFRVMKGINVEIRMKRTNTGREIICGNPEDYATMTKLDKVMMLTWGILFGMIPILAYMAIHESFLILLVPYSIAIIPDLKSITEVIRNG